MFYNVQVDDGFDYVMISGRGHITSLREFPSALFKKCLKSLNIGLVKVERLEWGDSSDRKKLSHLQHQHQIPNANNLATGNNHTCI